MVRILVVYHSQSGNTQRMAEAVAKGAAEMEQAVVELKRAVAVTADDLINCHGLVICSPEYFGFMAGAVKDLFDRTYEALKDHPRIQKKPFAIVISAGNDGQGALASIERIARGYRLKKIQHPIIAKGPVTFETIAQCEELGRVMAEGCAAEVF